MPCTILVVVEFMMFLGMLIRKGKLDLGDFWNLDIYMSNVGEAIQIFSGPTC
jgi:hypothetical protein